MKKKNLRRFAAIASSAVLCAGMSVMFAGCTTNNPEVRITYTFQGEDYEVNYRLSRLDAPKTVTHFIELADAGYYDGTCVHDYDGTYLYMGGYTIEGSELRPLDYFNKIKELEADSKTAFTQSVWMDNDARTPLYTVYGEFEANGNYPQNGRELTHEKGALVMFYTDKGNFNKRVITLRNDGGKNNNGEKYDSKLYKHNSATSLFYTYTGTSGAALDENYCVFGKAKEDDYEKQFEDGLLAAIKEYEESLAEDISFAEENTVRLNKYEPFEDLRKGDIDATFRTPIDKPIIVKSVKVTKY